MNNLFRHGMQGAEIIQDNSGGKSVYSGMCKAGTDLMDLGAGWVLQT